MTITIPSYTFDTSDKMTTNNIAVNTELNKKTTVEFFMQWDGTNSGMPFGWDTSYDLWLSNGFFGFNTGQGDVLGIESSSLVNRWVHVSAVFNNGEVNSDTCKLYIDGVLQNISLKQGSTPVERYVSSTFFLSGWDGNIIKYPFSGKISNLRIWDEERTAEQIINTPFNSNQNTNPRLLGFWKLDGNMNDESMYNNNGEGLSSSKFSYDAIDNKYLEDTINGKIIDGIDTTTWERSSYDNWSSPTTDSLKMLVNLNHDYIVSDVEFSNYTLRTDVKVLQSDDDGIGVVFDYLNNQNYKYIMYQGGGLGSAIYLDASGKRSAVILVDVVNGVHKTIAMNTLAPYWNINTTFNIRLENLFDDIFFYADDVLLLKYKKDNAISGKIGFVTFSQVADFNNITIEEPLLNRAKAKYVLYALGESELATEIVVSVGRESDVETSVISRAYRDDDFDTEIFAIYRGNLEALVEIQPIGSFDFETEIEVRPHNKMSAIFEVQQPPIVTTIYNPTQDSFTRENKAFETINYGGNSSMVVGNSVDDIWRSFVQFELGQINPSYILTESYLRLYYKGVAPEHLEIDIFNADQAWMEYNITNLNRPSPIKLISNEFTVNKAHGYIEFDILSVVEDWIALRAINNGFIIRVSNETIHGQTIFNTRESMFPPELVIKHYDSRIFSQGRSQFLVEMFVYKAEKTDVNVEIEIDSTFSFSTFDTEIYCHRPEVPILVDFDAEITTTKPHVFAELTVAHNDDSDTLAVIGSRIGDIRDKDIVFYTSKPYVLTEVFSKYRNDVETIITTRAIDELDIETVITVSVVSVLSEITPAIRTESHILTEISITRNDAWAEIKCSLIDEKEILVEIEANDVISSSKDVYLHVSKDSFKAEITPRIPDYLDVYTSIEVSRADAHAEITVTYTYDIWVEIEPNIKSDTLVEIIVSKDNTQAEIGVYGYEDSDILIELSITKFDNTNAEIFSKYRSEIKTEIDAISVSRIYAEVTSIRPNILTTVVVPTLIDMDIPTIIQPRILMVDNVYAIIQVGFVGGAYAFII